MCQKYVNRFRDIYAKVPKLFLQVQDMDVVTILQTMNYLFPDCSETIQTVWKSSRQSGNFLYCPESFHTVKKISRL